MPGRILYTIEPTDRKVLNWKELWHYRELFYFFTWRDVKVKYKQTVLGILWVVLQPILTVLIFSLFFGRALGVPSQGLPYPVFVFSGLLLWNCFAASINAAGTSMIAQANIIKKIYFPRIIIPISSIFVVAVDLLISFLVFCVLLIFYRVEIEVISLILYWPLSLLLTLVSTLGISCGLSALSVKYRDFKYVVPFGLQILLFMSPVLYPMSILNVDWLNYVLALNPMYGAISLFRMPLSDVPVPTIFLMLSTLSTVFFLAVGLYYFKRTEAFFADIA